jgi:filamentous hemagglutinin
MLGDHAEIAGTILTGGIGAGSKLVGKTEEVLVGAKGAADIGALDDVALPGLGSTPGLLSSPSIPSGAGLGGFKFGLSAGEINAINSKFDGSISFRSVDTAIANASNYDGFFNKAGSIIRDIAGGASV